MRESRRFLLILAVLIAVVVHTTWAVRHDTFWGEKGNGFFILSLFSATALTVTKNSVNSILSRMTSVGFHDLFHDLFHNREYVNSGRILEFT